METEDLAALPRTSPFLGTERFQVIRTLGAGAHGTVYEVLDRRREERLALKRLERAGGAALQHLKREFRALSGLDHPHLVALYELWVTGQETFFTMELAARGDLWSWRMSSPSVDWGQVESYLAGAAAGLVALHTMGKLHRDIKPSNVLLREDGEAMLCDFALAENVFAAADKVVGTRAFTAPEVLSGEAHTCASDWYSFGAMALALLTGQLPNPGERPPARDTGVPRRITELGLRLTDRDPGRRPPAEEVLDRLSRNGSRAAPRKVPFVGRHEALGQVQRAFALAPRDRPVLVRLHGPPGVGKSALVHEAIARSKRTDLVVLNGRSFGREAVPFRAFDGIATELAEKLEGAGPAVQIELIPTPLPALAKLFPVLAGVLKGAYAEAPLDQHELRRSAAAELRGLLGRCATRWSLALILDDFQDADDDSWWLLGQLLNGGAGGTLWFLLDRPSSSGREVSQLLSQLGPDVVQIYVALAPLSRDEMAAIWSAVAGVGAQAPALDEMEPPGPYEVIQLARARAAGLEVTRFSDLVAARMEALDAASAHLAEAVAVAGHPVEEPVLNALIEPSVVTAAMLKRLRASGLCRSRLEGETAILETAHDSIMDALRARAGPERATSTHRALAQAYLRLRRSSHRAVAHLDAAGLPDLATAHASAAAEEAERSLAFELAASLWGRAAEAEQAPRSRAEHRRRGARALVAAGRPSQAAALFAEAALDQQRAGMDPVQDEHAAAEQHLRCGELSPGLEILRRGMRQAGIRMARTKLGSLIRIAVTMARLRGRSSRRAAQVDARADRQFDVCWSAAMGFSMVDAIRGAEFEALSAKLGMNSAEPLRIARALGSNATYLASIGGARAWRDARRFLAEQNALAAGEPTSMLRAYSAMTTSIVAFFEGAWAECVRAGEEAERIIRRECTGTGWELLMAAGFSTTARAYSGDLHGLAERTADLVREMDDRSDLLGRTTLRLGARNRGWLAIDRPDVAERLDREAMRQWPHRGYHSQHYMHLVGECEVALYRGDGMGALQRLLGDWPKLRANLFFSREFVRAEMNALRSRCAALAARSAPAWRRRALARLIRRSAAALERCGYLGTDGWAASARAAVAELEGQPEEAHRRHEQAAALFERAGMQPSAAASRRAAARIASVPRTEHDVALRAFGVAHPERFSRVLIADISPPAMATP